MNVNIVEKKTKYKLEKHIKSIHSVDENDAKFCTICGHLKIFNEFYKTKYNTYMNRYKLCNNTPENKKKIVTYVIN